jgi:amidohydrolase
MECMMSEAWYAAWSAKWRQMESLQPRIDKIVAALHDDTIAVRRFLHANPEASGEEFETTRFLAERLREQGLQGTISPLGVGLTVDLEIGSPSADAPRIALRADIDGLRLSDRKNVAWASTRPGLCHGCGHDCHTAIVLGVACAAQRLAEDSAGLPPVRLRFVFQPAEESAQGARSMVDSGVMEDVAAIISAHVDPMYAAGTVGIRYGVLTAHCDEVLVRLDGRGGHAARPYLTSDPIAAAAQLISALHQNLPRCVDPRNPSVFTIGRIHAGEASNVIPDHVEMSGSLRTTDAGTREVLIERLQEIGKSIELGTGNRITIGLHNSLAAVHNEPRIVAAMETVAQSVVGDEGVHRLDRPSMGGEDFSAYLKHSPGGMIRLGCGGDATDWPALHSPFFDVDERVLEIGLSLMLRTALLLATGSRSMFSDFASPELLPRADHK